MPGMLRSAASAENSSSPLFVLSASAMLFAPARLSLTDENSPDGSAAAVPPATSDGVSRSNVHSSEVKVSCLAMIGSFQAYCLLISTRRASASLPPAPTSTNIGGFISTLASATPAAFSASRTAAARLLASSSFFATSPVLSV